MSVFVRKTRPSELDAVWAMIDNARTFLKAQGLPQWQDGYGPSKQKMADRIEQGQSYVLILDNQRIVATASLLPEDPTYDNVIEGAWNAVPSDVADKGFLSVHDFAVHADMRGRGMAKLLLDHLKTLCSFLGKVDFRIDTHPENVIMKKAIMAAGFKRIGVVEKRPKIPNGERVAYQMFLM